MPINRYPSYYINVVRNSSLQLNNHYQNIVAHHFERDLEHWPSKCGLANCNNWPIVLCNFNGPYQSISQTSYKIIYNDIPLCADHCSQEEINLAGWISILCDKIRLNYAYT